MILSTDYGDVTIKTAFMPSVSINHQIIYDFYGKTLSRSFAREIEQIRTCREFKVRLITPTKINGVIYQIEGAVTSLGSKDGQQHVIWSGARRDDPQIHMTTAAKQKLGIRLKRAGVTERICEAVQNYQEQIREEAVEDFHTKWRDTLLQMSENIIEATNGLNSAVEHAGREDTA